jgi:hypothetical protein
MFKKFTALLLITAFTNAYAITPMQQASELNKTFDLLNYKLNVEWDQKDSKVFDATISDFEKEIAELQKAGVTSKDLIDYTSAQIKDKRIQNDINELSQIITETQMSDEEARAFVVSKLSSTYSHGASWSGSEYGVRNAIIIGAIIVILVICLKKHHKKDRCDYNNNYNNNCGYEQADVSFASAI